MAALLLLLSSSHIVFVHENLGSNGKGSIMIMSFEIFENGQLYVNVTARQLQTKTSLPGRPPVCN